MSDPLLAITGLTVRFDAMVAVDHLDMAVQPGEIFALVGPNGAGKTTVLNCISGFVRPTAGTITLAGRDLLALRPDERVRAGIGRTFQQVQLFGTQTVLDNLLIAQHTILRSDLFTGLLPFGRAPREESTARQRALELLATLGLQDYANVVASALPFGVQKLVGVARALVARPQVVLLDEPAAGVPHDNVLELGTQLRQWRDQLGVTLVLIEHNMRLVQSVADRVCVLDYGRKLAEGEPAAVLREPAVLEAYLGRDAAKGDAYVAG